MYCPATGKVETNVEGEWKWSALFSSLNISTPMMMTAAEKMREGKRERGRERERVDCFSPQKRSRGDGHK